MKEEEDLVVCVRRGEGGPLYSANRSVPALNKYGNIVHRLGVDQDDLPAKIEVDWRQSGAGRPCGLAGPQVAPLAPPRVLDTVKWAPNLCMSVPRLGWSVWSGLLAFFPCVTQDAIVCDFVCIFVVFSSYF